MLKKLKPVTASQRNTVLLKYSNYKKNLLLKKKIKWIKRANGRNNQGKITCKYRGGGHKRKYRIINFNRKNLNGFVQNIQYDPNRSAQIALINNKKNSYYIIAPQNLKFGDYIESGENVSINNGNSLPLKNIPLGSLIHNIELKLNKGGQLVRSAGTFAQLLQKTTTHALLRLSSGEHRLILINCYATLGVVSNNDYKNIKIGKAGRNRWLNRRPKVRGVAMNPIDHPHGGGEGKTSGGRSSVSFKGIITKGKITKKKINKLIIKKRSKKYF